MPVQWAENRVKENRDVESVWPYGFGEPSLHPHLSEIIQALKRENQVVSLSTNATTLSQARAATLLATDLDYLIIAIDGSSRATYEANRYPATFDAVEARVNELLREKLRKESRTHVTVQMVRMKNNAHEADRFVRRWQRPGVDVVRVRDDLSGAAEPGVAMDVRAEGKVKKRRPCFFLWRGPLFVQASGNVIPCPYYHGEGAVGSLQSHSSRDVWQSKALERMRKAHIDGDLSDYPVCAACPRLQPMRLLAVISFFITTWHIRRIFPYLEHFQRWCGIKAFE
jgi:radical SAM protein with 4Fe4S-binding SPASM domain